MSSSSSSSSSSSRQQQQPLANSALDARRRAAEEVVVKEEKGLKPRFKPKQPVPKPSVVQPVHDTTTDKGATSVSSGDNQGRVDSGASGGQQDKEVRDRRSRDRARDKNNDDKGEGRSEAKPRSRERNIHRMMQGADYFTGDSGGSVSSRDKEKAKKDEKKDEKPTSSKIVVKEEEEGRKSHDEDGMELVVEESSAFSVPLSGGAKNYADVDANYSPTLHSMEVDRADSPQQPKAVKVHMMSDSEDSSDDDDEFDDFIDNDDDDEYLRRVHENSKHTPATLPYQNIRHLNITPQSALFTGNDDDDNDDDDDDPVQAAGRKPTNHHHDGQRCFLLQLPSNLKIRESDKKEIYEIDDDGDDGDGDVGNDGSMTDLSRENGIDSYPPTGDMGGQSSNEGVLHAKKNIINGILQPGKIGKLQQYKSGKCYLVTNDGKRYMINSGMPVNFSQYLANISASSPSNSAIQHSSTSSSNVRIKKESSSDGVFIKKESTSGVATTNNKNDLYFISKIKTKLVVTPAFDIGEKTPRVSAEPDMIYNNIANSYMHTGDLAVHDLSATVSATSSSASGVGTSTAAASTLAKGKVKNKKMNNSVSPGVESAAEVLASFAVKVVTDDEAGEVVESAGAGATKKKAKATSKSKQSK